MFRERIKGHSRELGILKKLRKFYGCFERVSGKFKGCLKCIYSLLNMVCFIVVVWQLAQLPEQKEGLFNTSIVINKVCVPSFRLLNTLPSCKFWWGFLLLLLLLLFLLLLLSLA